MSHERASTLPIAGGERALGWRRGCAGRFVSLGLAGFAWPAGRIDPLARIGAAQASQPGPAALLSLMSADSVTPWGQGWVGAGHPA